MYFPWNPSSGLSQYFYRDFPVFCRNHRLSESTQIKICNLEIWSLYFLFLWHNKHCLQWINIFTGRGLEKRTTTSVILVNSVREMPRPNTTGKKKFLLRKCLEVVLSFLWQFGSDQFLLVGSSNFQNWVGMFSN